jgi:hypothetical protein
MNLFFGIISIFLLSSTAFSEEKSKIDSTNCICTKIFMPVCAGNRTFGNSCEAECAGHKIFVEGECTKPINKPQITPTYKKTKTK